MCYISQSGRTDFGTLRISTSTNKARCRPRAPQRAARRSGPAIGAKFPRRGRSRSSEQRHSRNRRARARTAAGVAQGITSQRSAAHRQDRQLGMGHPQRLRLVVRRALQDAPGRPEHAEALVQSVPRAHRSAGPATDAGCDGTRAETRRPSCHRRPRRAAGRRREDHPQPGRGLLRRARARRAHVRHAAGRHRPQGHRDRAAGHGEPLQGSATAGEDRQLGMGSDDRRELVVG